MRSWPYSCPASAFRPASLTLIITMKVEKTSLAECTASEIMALELASTPANSLKRVNSRLTAMLLRETRMAIWVAFPEKLFIKNSYLPLWADMIRPLHAAVGRGRR